MVEYVDKVDYHVSDYITTTSTFLKPMFYEAVDPLGGPVLAMRVSKLYSPVRNQFGTGGSLGSTLFRYL